MSAVGWLSAVGAIYDTQTSPHVGDGNSREQFPERFPREAPSSLRARDGPGEGVGGYTARTEQPEYGEQLVKDTKEPRIAVAGAITTFEERTIWDLETGAVSDNYSSPRSGLRTLFDFIALFHRTQSTQQRNATLPLVIDTEIRRGYTLLLEIFLTLGTVPSRIHD